MYLAIMLHYCTINKHRTKCNCQSEENVTNITVSYSFSEVCMYFINEYSTQDNVFKYIVWKAQKCIILYTDRNKKLLPVII